MTSVNGTGGPNTPAEIEADIVRQREELADTVTALQTKLDVKAKAKHKAAELKDRATTDSGTPRPTYAAGALAAVAALVGLVVWRRRARADGAWSVRLVSGPPLASGDDFGSPRDLLELARRRAGRARPRRGAAPAAGSTRAWACWDDPAVDWAAADLVAVRSTWDYTERPEEFLAWARAVDGRTLLLNGADVFAWNHDKAYLAELGDGARRARRAPPTPSRSSRAAVAAFGTAVVKPRVGAGGGGVIVVDDPADPRLGTVIQSHPAAAVGGPVGRAAAGRVGADRGRDLGLRARRRRGRAGRQAARGRARSGSTSSSAAPRVRSPFRDEHVDAGADGDGRGRRRRPSRSTTGGWT